MNSCSYDKWHIGTVHGDKRACQGDRKPHLFLKGRELSLRK